MFWCALVKKKEKENLITFAADFLDFQLSLDFLEIPVREKTYYPSYFMNNHLLFLKKYKKEVYQALLKKNLTNPSHV